MTSSTRRGRQSDDSRVLLRMPGWVNLLPAAVLARPVVVSYILVPRAYDPSGLRQESRALGATISGMRHRCRCAVSRITRIRLFPLFFHNVCSQSSRFLPQARWIVGSGVENGYLKDVRAHCYCASLVRTLYMTWRVPRHVFQARAPSRNSIKYRAGDLCDNLICEYFFGSSVTPTFISADHFLFWFFPLF